MTMHDLRRSRLNPAVIMAAFVAVLILDALTSVAAQGELSRIWNDLAARPSGPFGVRFWIQPIVAMSLGIAEGTRDARSGRTPYLATLLHDRAERRGRLVDGVMMTSRIMLLGLAIDAVCQLIIFKTIYPFEAFLVAALLAFVPYALARRSASWIARFRMAHANATDGIR